jgi:hypothetical protein
MYFILYNTLQTLITGLDSEMFKFKILIMSQKLKALLYLKLFCT